MPAGWADSERYIEYLTRRLSAPRAFAEEAERVGV